MISRAFSSRLFSVRERNISVRLLVSSRLSFFFFLHFVLHRCSLESRRKNKKKKERKNKEETIRNAEIDRAAEERKEKECRKNNDAPASNLCDPLLPRVFLAKERENRAV